jgi:FKBP-type peptidyl-prolyl cis-trans isomerase FkpA/FKBP-type peptidyl-prolyl cis-trans isomerase FklB
LPIFDTSLRSISHIIGQPLIKERRPGKLLIPSGLANGDNNRPGIPPNSVLIFDIHLIEVL